MGGFNLQDLMSKAKAQYESLQRKMQETVVEASSGGGTVTAKMDGRKQLLSLRIDPEAVKTGDVEMLQDLVLAADQRSGAPDRCANAIHRGRDARWSEHPGTVKNYGIKWVEASPLLKSVNSTIMLRRLLAKFALLSLVAVAAAQTQQAQKQPMT